MLEEGGVTLKLPCQMMLVIVLCSPAHQSPCLYSADISSSCLLRNGHTFVCLCLCACKPTATFTFQKHSSLFCQPFCVSVCSCVLSVRPGSIYSQLSCPSRLWSHLDISLVEEHQCTYITEFLPPSCAPRFTFLNLDCQAWCPIFFELLNFCPYVLSPS